TTRVSAAMVHDVERDLVELEKAIEMPREFVVPGETPTSAALELDRTILRRAEGRAVGVQRDVLVPGPNLIPYLNRLADLVWVLARAAERAESRSATPARTPGAARAREKRTRRPNPPSRPKPGAGSRPASRVAPRPRPPRLRSRARS